MIAGQRTTISVPVGNTLNILASSGSGSLVDITQSEPGAPVALTGSATTFGPFDAIMNYRIECVTGEINFDIVGTVAGRLANQIKYRSSLKAGGTKTYYLPAGGVLNIDASDGTGSVVRLSNPIGGEPGSPTQFTGVPLSFGPFDITAIFRIHSRTGVMNFGNSLSLNLTPNISGNSLVMTAGQAFSGGFNVVPAGTPVTVTVTRNGQPDTLAAHNIVHNGFGQFTSTGPIL